MATQIVKTPSASQQGQNMSAVPWWHLFAFILQFFDHLKLFWMPAKHQPDFMYLRHVPLRKVHCFTVIQLTCLALLRAIKVPHAAIIFPMMVRAAALGSGMFAALERDVASSVA